MVIILILIITFILLTYRNFIHKIILEKNIQHQQEIQHQKNNVIQGAKVQEEERKRIAQLIHDDIGNKLNILSVWLNNPNAWNNERSKEIVAKQIPELIEATRNISHALFPVNLEHYGMILTLEELIANIESSLTVHLIIVHPYTPGAMYFELQLYRIIQEYLSNVLKHAEASQMFIQLRDSSKYLCITLSDNGIGFDVNSASKGMGLRNIASRIKSMDAVYRWKSIKNKGSQLTIVIPKT
ncbi:histidine kinase/DNA gyrase B/HSP90-like ATPase [Pedobacter metabolipauper]|uniref:histidine kinase n=2 Tax=Pedobacter metabolipauper TaxID=425513 RepID=A0A4R6STX4_9SPHI|nr:histidine kinase/DNA gyrase B/HSP90-like ATPase [Pedobacter metabolipauper]